MEIDSSIIKKLRAQRNWTQQHLADACDLSLRTIQRIEKLGNASNESVMSLCSVFEIQKIDICTIPKMTDVKLQKVELWGYYLIVFGGLLIGMFIGAGLMYYWMNQ